MLPIMGLALLGAGSVSAHGLFGMGMANQTPEEIATRQQEMFQNEAKILGISVNEVKDAWAEGKTIQQIASEKGISQELIQARLKEARLEQAKTHLKALVDKGVITQAQADARLKVMQTRIDSGKGGMGRGFRRGFDMP